MSATFTKTRTAIDSQLTNHWAANGILWARVNVVEPAYPAGRLMFIVEGATLTSGQAADKYLPGGFAANFGRV